MYRNWVHELQQREDAELVGFFSPHTGKKIELVDGKQVRNNVRYIKLNLSEYVPLIKNVTYNRVGSYFHFS